jgi:hypothetical protein
VIGLAITSHHLSTNRTGLEARKGAMRHFPAVVVAVCLGLLGGCVSPGPQRAPEGDVASRPFAEPLGADVIVLDLAVVERPLADPLLDQDPWELADEQTMPFEQKVHLRENGFRVGQIGGQPPAALPVLLAPRNCPAGCRRVRTRIDTPLPVVLGGMWPRVSFRVTEGGEPRNLELAEAECLLELRAAPLPEGGVRICFTPHVRHGQAIVKPTAIQEPSGSLRWNLEAQQPEEVFPDLAWESTLAAGEYLLVGTLLEEPETLGHRCFVSEGPGSFLARGSRKAVQRLLIIRPGPVQGPSGGEESINRSPPLAARASLTQARGYSR